MSQMQSIVEPHKMQAACDVMQTALQDVPYWGSSFLSLLPEMVQLAVAPVTCSMLVGWAVLPHVLVWAFSPTLDAGCFYDPAAKKLAGSKKGGAQRSFGKVDADSCAEAKVVATTTSVVAPTARPTSCAALSEKQLESRQSAMALLEAYGILGAGPGTWSGNPLPGECRTCEQQASTEASCAPPSSIGRSQVAERAILEHYGVLGAAPGSWSSSSSDASDDEEYANEGATAKRRGALPLAPVPQVDRVTVGILTAVA